MKILTLKNDNIKSFSSLLARSINLDWTLSKDPTSVYSAVPGVFNRTKHNELVILKLIFPSTVQSLVNTEMAVLVMHPSTLLLMQISLINPVSVWSTLSLNSIYTQVMASTIGLECRVTLFVKMVLKRNCWFYYVYVYFFTSVFGALKQLLFRDGWLIGATSMLAGLNWIRVCFLGKFPCLASCLAHLRLDQAH